MHDTKTNQAQGPDHQPVTPFLQSQNYIQEEVQETFASEPEFSQEQHHHPFASDYQLLDGEEGQANPEQEEFIGLIAEFYEEEFDTEMYELVAEASQYYQSQFPVAIQSDTQLADRQALRQMEDYFAPMHEDLEIIFDNMIGEVDEIDVAAMSDDEKDVWVESFFTEDENFEFESPEIEYGWRSRAKKRRQKRKQKRKKKWKGLKNKVKKAVKKIAKKVKRLGKKAIKGLLKKLKKFAKKLLRHVLKIAINKIPARYRPLADMLRKRFIKSEVGEEFEIQAEMMEGVFQLQFEFDYQLASSISGETSEMEIEGELEELMDNQMDDDSLEELSQARELFVQQIMNLQEGEDPAPYIEQFIPAILQAIKLVARPIIRVIGRDKVIQFLAKYVAKLTGKFIKKKNLNKLLSTALVDVGLRLMQLEVEVDDEQEAAGAAITGLVEDTVRKTMELSPAIFEDEQMLEMHILEAFEQAAAANLPAILPSKAYENRPNLKEAANSKNAWAKLPFRKRRRRNKRYKKAIRTYKRKIQAHAARKIKSFGEIPLEHFLEEQLGIQIGSGVEAEIHLYEVLAGTQLSDIAGQENYIPSLKNGYAFNYSLMHPLTTQAAGLLLGEPGLGRDVPAMYLQQRNRIRSGQRFYYLDVAGAKLQTTLEEGMLRLCRLSGLRLKLDFIKNELKINLYLSEKLAQQIAIGLRGKHTSGIALTHATKVVTELLTRNFALAGQNNISIVHPYVIPGASSSRALRRIPPYLIELMQLRIQDWMISILSSNFKAQAESFIAASRHEQDGLTLCTTISQPAGFGVLKKILANTPTNIPADLFDQRPEQVHLSIKAGYHHG